YSLNQNPIKYNVENGDVTKWFNTPVTSTGFLKLNRICYVPSRDTVIIGTGQRFGSTIFFTEVDLNGNILNENIFSQILDQHGNAIATACPPAYYHAKTNKIYYTSSDYQQVGGKDEI